MTDGVAVHTISFRGLSGSIFITMTVACIVALLGVATPMWSVKGTLRYGLWEICSCTDVSDVPAWFTATQAMIVIGMIGLYICMVIISIYMCVHSLNKNKVIIALILTATLSFIFLLIGVIIYAAYDEKFSWSFILTIIGTALCLLAGVLSCVQMKKAGVNINEIRS